VWKYSIAEEGLKIGARTGKAGPERRGAMDEKDDKLGQLLHGDFKVDRRLERLDDLETLTEIIHQNRVNGARSSEIARAIVKFVKEG
jgi:hypothetical protein